MIDENIFREIAKEVEYEWHCGGLSAGMYYDFAKEVAHRYIKRHLTKKFSGLAKLTANMKDMPPEFQKVVDQNFWDLI
jgi:hypothetical protein